MSVHYKFKAALDYSTVTFDGIHISVSDLKKEIIEQKHLKQNADFDLQIINAQTKEVYEDEKALIPKNTSVIVARIPVTEKRRTGGPGAGGGGGSYGGHRSHYHHHPRNFPPTSVQPSALAKGVDLASMDATEEEKIKAMMSQSTQDYDPSKYQRIRGSGQHGRVPPSYRCNKCNNLGHWIKDCPFQPDRMDVKKSTGIPRSFMVHVEGPGVPGALMTPEGRFAVPAVDHAAHKNKLAAEPPPPKPKIPEELVCTLCDDLMTDALLVPCCANSYCDECIRKALLDSDDQECPSCHEKDILPNALIANRFLRTTVNKFKNETGYSKPLAVVKKDPVVVVDLTDKKDDGGECRKLSLDELPDDLFPHSPRKIDPDAKETERESFQEQNAGDEEEEKTDLYDFNEGSIPSPFAAQSEEPPTKPERTEQAIKTIGTTSHHFYTDSKPMRGGPPLPHSMDRQQQHPMDRQQQHPMDRQQQHSMDRQQQHPMDRQQQHSMDRQQQHPMDRQQQHPMDRQQQQHGPPSHHQNRPQKDHYRHPPRMPLQIGMPPLPSMQSTTHYSQPLQSRRPPVIQGPPPHDRPLDRPPDMRELPKYASDMREPPKYASDMREPPKYASDMREPPPPGFGDILPLPPGDEDSIPTPTARGRDERDHPRERGEMGSTAPDGLPAPPKTIGLLPLPGIPPFNPTQPPPGFSSASGSSQQPPPSGKGPIPPPQGMFSGPPSQNFPPYGSDYRMNDRHGPMYHPGGPPMSSQDRDYPPTERMMRKPLLIEDRPRELERPGEVRTGAIDDPLKEFERLMREKDRRKKMQPMAKRSRSRSFSPSRRSPSPFGKRSRSPRSPISRSPSPSFVKRKRPALRRRKSYSRSPSRSPPPLPRRHLRSRSRSRNRSMTPTSLPPLKRRSPHHRRPYSPSQPPPWFPPARKEKDEFYENRPPRYDTTIGAGGGSRRFYNPNRDYNDPSSKYDMPPSMYMDQQKFEPPAVSGSVPPAIGTAGGNGKFEKFDHRGPPPSNREYQQQGGPMYRERERDNRGVRDRVDRREDHRDRPPMMPYDFNDSIIPPGTETSIPPQSNNNNNNNNAPIRPSLFELNIPPPTNYPPSEGPLLNPPEPSSNYYPPPAHHTGSFENQQHSHQSLLPPPHHHQQSSERERRPTRTYGQTYDRYRLDRVDDRGMRDRDARDRGDLRVRSDRGRESLRDRDSVRERERERDLENVSVSLTPDGLDVGADGSRDGKKRHVKKSRESSSEKLDKKKDRKEKKKHKKRKESKEEKKIRKSKKAKPSGKSGKVGSEDDQTTTADEGGPPSRRNSTSEHNDSLQKTPNDSTIVESGPIIQEEKTKTETTAAAAGVKVESPHGQHEVDSMNSNLTVIVCDSTVKSPETSTLPVAQKSSTVGSGLDSITKVLEPTVLHSDEYKSSNGMKLDESLHETKVDLSTDAIETTIATKDEANVTTVIETVMVNRGGAALDDGFNPKDHHECFEESNKIMDIPRTVPSKWDQFEEDEDVPNAMSSNVEQSYMMKTSIDDSGNASSPINKELTPKKVTSEVLKRAENAIFQKAISGISLPTHSSTVTKKSSPTAQPSSSKRKVYVEKLEATESESKDDSKTKDVDGSETRKSGPSFQVAVSAGDQSSKPDTLASSTRGAKRSALERLGSKIKEDRSSSSRSRRRSSSSQERDRDKDRHKTVKSLVKSLSQITTTSSSSYRERADRDRDRRDRRSSRTPPRSATRNRVGRSRSRSRERRGRERAKVIERRSRSRSAKRSSSKTQRDRVRQFNRQKAPLELKKRRSRSSSREHRRSRSRSKPHRSSSHSHSYNESQGKGGVDTENPAAASTTKETTTTEDNREPTPPGLSEKPLTPQLRNKLGKTEGGDDVSESGNVPPVRKEVVVNQKGMSDDDSESSDDNISSINKTNPMPLAMRKQKGRINIKLSSTTSAAKGDPSKSSSSSSEDDEHDKHDSSKQAIRTSDSDDERKEERKRKKERKAAKKSKRRRSESTSSSSSDDSTRRKSKKSKKKKKKSKKRRRQK